MISRKIGAIIGAAVLLSCSTEEKKTETMSETSLEGHAHFAHDTHSFGQPEKVAVSSLHLDLDVNFDEKIISGTVTHQLDRASGNELILDVDDLDIQSVKDDQGRTLDFEVKKGDEYGDALHIKLLDDTKSVEVAYATGKGATALLWMNPEQTLGKTAPFMFTQGQAILTRSWIPIQDSPSIRITYTAQVKVPSGLMALMSAENPTEKNDEGVYSFKMDQPIPPYLMALAVGDLTFASLGERSGVYAEPAMIDKASYEFADVEEMTTAAEELYGPYRWGQYDIIVLPPSFPFGGMENPRLTFATPTIIAGDRSLTSLIAHELAHSWSGNLVTNATWDDFWLNEGFTVYFEKRIMEALYGREYAEMLNVLGSQDLENTMEELGRDSKDTHLKLELDGRNPDDGMTDVAYEKGYLFLRWLEEMVGRPTFDEFLKTYFNSHAFETMTTEEFIVYLDENLLNKMDERPDVEAWIYKPGLPEGHPVPVSDRFEKVDQARMAWESGDMNADKIESEEWTTHEWLHFVRGLSADVDVNQMKELDTAFELTQTGNSEIAAAWFQQSIDKGYKDAYPQLEAFLLEVGRRKFLKPLYEALATNPDDLAWAQGVYAKARSGYHAVSVETIDQILNYSEEG